MNPDLVIFIGFLMVNLAVGLFYSKGINTLKEFALGSRGFSTAAITTTLVATWIDGSFFSVNLSKTYTDGLYFILPALGDVLAFLIVGNVLAPKMARFLGKLSVAEAMGDLYGRHARIITALAAIGLATGVVALQIKVLSELLNQFFPINGFYGLIFSTIVIVSYSAFGGIKSVTFTDIIQLFTFGTFIPGVALIIWGTLNSPSVIVNTLSNNPLFDYTQVLDYSNPRFFSCLTLFLWFAIPSLDPAIFQRIAIAKNTFQVSKSFSYAALVCFFTLITISWIGVLILSSNNSLDPNELVRYIINNYSYLGLKSLIIIGIMAMIMSTADSYINSAAVLFAHDICKPLNIKRFINKEIILSRGFSLFIGIFATLIALSTTDLLELTLIASSLYMPIVTVPLILAILGFRTSSKVVLAAMLSGFVTVVIFKFINIDINSVIFGVIANFVTLVGGHYIFKQPGGWIKEQERAGLVNKKGLSNLASYSKKYNLWALIGKGVPTQEAAYPFLGLFCIVSIFSSVYSLPINAVEYYSSILELIYHTVLIFSTIFLSYPIWPARFKQDIFIKLIWLLGVFYILIFIGMTLVIISNFAQFHLMVFALNLMVIAILHTWKYALVLICSGVSVSIFIFKSFFGINNFFYDIGNLQFKIMYVLLLVTSMLIAFTRPRRKKYNKLVSREDKHLGLEEIALSNNVPLKNELIEDTLIKHRAHISYIINSLWTYPKLNDTQIRMYFEELFLDTLKLELFKTNIISLYNLIESKHRLIPEPINLSDLLFKRLKAYNKLCKRNKNHRPTTYIERDIIINADKHYFVQAMDNLIINVIASHEQREAVINLKKSKNGINFSVDIEVSDSFVKKLKQVLSDEFELNFKDHNHIEPTVIGLTLYKEVIQRHYGTLKVEYIDLALRKIRLSFTMPLRK